MISPLKSGSMLMSLMAIISFGFVNAHFPYYPAPALAGNQQQALYRDKARFHLAHNPAEERDQHPLLKNLQQVIPLNDSILHQKWKAKWIEAAGTNPTGYGIYHFRKELKLQTLPSSFIMHVSADNRYKLFVNGILVSIGPARGDIYHWYYESVDLLPYLKTGNNIIAALVWNEGPLKPQAQLSYRTGFILQGDSYKEAALNTNSTWKATADSAYSMFTPPVINFGYLTGSGERVDFPAYPGNWLTGEDADAGWKAAVPIIEGVPGGVFDWSDGWMLLPSSIPAMELKVQRFRSVRKVSGIPLSVLATGFGQTVSDRAAQAPELSGWQHAIIIPANTRVVMLLDQGYLSNAYPVLKFSGGKAAGISLSYTEALYKKEENSGGEPSYHKLNRNLVEGMVFLGRTDTLIADGSPHEYSPLWYRSYRYLQLTVQTRQEPLKIGDIYSLFCGYPFSLNARFQSADTLLQRIFTTGWRTARACAMETYMDCPYYEELQYVGDTRIQSLVSIFNSGDDRLMRRAITQLDYSRIPEGLTLSRYPSTHQLIPPFSLWWIGMVHDYWKYRGDLPFISSMLNGTRQVLQFFNRYQQAGGSLGLVPYWNFADWSSGPGWDNGTAPHDGQGNSAMMDLQLLWAYQLAADLEQSAGDKSIAATYRDRAAELSHTILLKYWDPGKGLFTDLPGKQVFSQHTNSLAILTRLVTGSQATSVAEKLLTDKSLVQSTIYFRYYMNQALVQAGMGDRYLDFLGDWKVQLAHGMSTWAEISDVDNARSDCHAWGASPNIELIRTVLGIDADLPGFQSVLITPHPGKLTSLSGSMPHPGGLITVSYQKKGKVWLISILLPSGIPGTLNWYGHLYRLEPGKETRLKI